MTVINLGRIKLSRKELLRALIFGKSDIVITIEEKQ